MLLVTWGQMWFVCVQRCLGPLFGSKYVRVVVFGCVSVFDLAVINRRFVCFGDWKELIEGKLSSIECGAAVAEPGQRRRTQDPFP